MKKYFLFDDEPISGNTYWRRILFGSLLMIFLVGFWTLAATGYKRAGTFGWKKEFRIISAVLIPIFAIGKILSKSPGYKDSPINLFDIFTLLAVVFHLILLFKNGNKKSKEIPTKISNNELEENLNMIRIKIKNVDNELQYQLSGNTVNKAEKLMISQSHKFIILFEDENDNFIIADELPIKAFNENSNYYIKSGVFTYVCSKKISPEKFARIAKCKIEAVNK